MYTVTLENMPALTWGIDSLAVALAGARSDADKFGVTATVTDGLGRVIQTFAPTRA